MPDRLGWQGSSARTSCTFSGAAGLPFLQLPRCLLLYCSLFSFYPYNNAFSNVLKADIFVGIILIHRNSRVMASKNSPTYYFTPFLESISTVFIWNTTRFYCLLLLYLLHEVIAILILSYSLKKHYTWLNIINYSSSFLDKNQENFVKLKMQTSPGEMMTLNASHMIRDFSPLVFQYFHDFQTVHESMPSS